MINDLYEHYNKLLKKNGVSSKAVQYSDKESHYKRFEILCQINLEMESVIDVGCGLGHLYDYLSHINPEVKYLGLDFIEGFITAAKDVYKGQSNVDFKVHDIKNNKIPNGFDYCLLSGVFNNKMKDNKAFLFETIKKMFKSANKGIAFNCMSTYVDYQVDELFYTDPMEIFDFCKKELSRYVVLRHDYLVKKDSIPFEYSIYVYKN